MGWKTRGHVEQPPMKLLHTSDWHLGRSLMGLSLLEDQAHFCEQLVELVHDFQPDLVVILGDLFERSVPAEDALQLLDQVLQRLLLECKVRVLMAPGHQDGIARLNFGSWLYERRQLHLITNLEQALSPILLEDSDGPVHINAIPYLAPSEVESHFRTRKVTGHGQAGNTIMEHLTRFRRLRRSAVRGVVAGYLWVEGGETCGQERPLQGADPHQVSLTSFEGIHYAALGYLHQHQILGERGQYCYSGSPLSFTFETTPTSRGVVKMEMNGRGECQSELIPFSPLRQFLKFSGSLERLLLGPPHSLQPQDLVVLELSETTDLLSVELLQRLRTLYPNLWRVERKAIEPLGRDRGEFDPLESFRHFYQDTTGQSLQPEELALLQEAFLEGQP